MIPQVKVSDKSAYCLIELSGRFIEDASDVMLVEQIDGQCKQGKAHFIIDLSALTYMNSTGINLLVKCIKRLNDCQARVVFTSAPDHILELLNIIQLNSIIHISPSIEEGIQNLNLS